MIPSKDYLEALLNKDQELIASVYKECYPGVKKFIENNSGTMADAEDVFQRALLQLAVRYSKEAFEIHGPFNAYLFTVCKNLWLREINKSKKRVTNQDIVNLYYETDDQALALLEQKRQELFVEKLSLISENCKKVLELYFAKVAYAEIMRRLVYNSETVVRQRVFKCKQKLSDLVKSDNRYLSLREI